MSEGGICFGADSSATERVSGQCFKAVQKGAAERWHPEGVQRARALHQAERQTPETGGGAPAQAALKIERSALDTAMGLCRFATAGEPEKA